MWVHWKDWGVVSVGSGSQLRTPPHADTTAKQPPPRGNIQNISNMVPHPKQGQKKTRGGRVCARVQNCVWGCVVTIEREGLKREKE